MSLLPEAAEWAVMPDVPEPTAWVGDALCAQTDPEVFFPDQGGSTRAAKRVCARCDVRAECLDYALISNEPYGVWGGVSARERHAMRRGGRR